MKLHELNISAAAFWDVDYDSLDTKQRSTFIIGKVLTYGSFEDIRQLFIHFGPERIRNEVTNANSLDPKSMNFIAKILNIPPTEFSCYKRIQLLRNSGSYYIN